MMSKIVYNGIYGNTLTVNTDSLSFVSFTINEKDETERFAMLKVGDIYTLIQQLREMLNLLAQQNMTKEQSKSC